MAGKKHSPEQVVRKLREAEAELAAGQSVGQVCQKLGVTEATFHRWRNQYGGMKADGGAELSQSGRH
jgi:transposase-like protein